MSKALYRKYRSKSLGEIVGQSHITTVLERSIDQGRVAHAYLLTGPRGVGKTSIARILAHEINKLPYDEQTSHLDIIEIDAASNNGVEDIRDLREKVRLAPVSAEKKIYIIDEVHMLSKPAFNALLKTLEEPPEHIVFILATTDVEKLPATIISRTQQFSFRAITPGDAFTHLKTIAKQEKIKVDDDALHLIARRGDGSFRDSIGLLDQLSSLADDKQGITRELVEQSLGLASIDIINTLIEAYEEADLARTVSMLDEAMKLGIPATTLAEQLTDEVRKHVTTKPQLLTLLNQLIEVPSSLQPDIKLLTVLASSTANTAAVNAKPKHAALLAPVEVISAPIKELERKATQPKPKESRKKAALPQANLTELDWNAVVEHARQHYVAISSVLVKCTAEVTDANLTIYTGNKFYKKKIDDAKYRPMVIASLEALGFHDLVIDTIPTTSPLKDEQAAKVAAIMGGGEEVSL